MGNFTNVLWYLEFLAFAIVLMLFFGFILYLAKINYVSYNPRFDLTKKTKRDGPESKRVFVQNQRPVCCDLGCILFCRIIGSITIIAVCYYFAYTLISDTKLKTKCDRLESSRVSVPNQRPVCCDLGCVWFCGIMGSITTIALCYYFAYTLISDTKLRFGMFVPRFNM